MIVNGIIVVPDMEYGDYSADICGTDIPVPHSAVVKGFYIYDTVTDQYCYCNALPKGKILYCLRKTEMIHAGMTDEIFLTLHSLYYALYNGEDAKMAECDIFIEKYSGIPKHHNMLEELAMQKTLITIAEKFKRLIREVNAQGRENYLFRHCLNEHINGSIMRNLIPIDSNLMIERCHDFLKNEDRYKDVGAKYGVNNIFNTDSYKEVPGITDGCDKLLELHAVRKKAHGYSTLYRHVQLVCEGRIMVNMENRQRSGRTSCTQPNISGVDRCDRDVIKADNGWAILSIDLKSVEPRVAASVYNDPVLKADTRSDDMYRLVQEEIAVKLGIELNIKTVKHNVLIPFLYGQMPIGCADSAGISVADAKKIHELLNTRYSAMVANILTSIIKSRQNGHITLYNGHRLLVTEKNRNTQLRNHFIQANAAAVFFEAVQAIDKALKEFNAYIFMTRHDEILFHVPADELCEVQEVTMKILRETFEAHFQGVPFPVDAESGQRWMA